MIFLSFSGLSQVKEPLTITNQRVVLNLPVTLEKNTQVISGVLHSGNVSINQRFAKLKGTFQIQTSNDPKILITSEMLSLVESSRAQSQPVIVPLIDGVNLYVLSKESINGDNFIGLPLFSN